ncbi:hypothetical protein CAPTEDRAFT_200628 [Capitella teleta]|uniref:WSC domain-containing protein n=1 Tax=Capitella teleta TaxID=283909 RepID=R7TRT3_CAPTE|nr:hypothetical protein CAPTEDRAFT_200628 [Capitella teleta]|eukprot:ELT96329.1 hypothetical protein CAPTEDRAFT_200628 [Capitella teleta]
MSGVSDVLREVQLVIYFYSKKVYAFNCINNRTIDGQGSRRIMKRIIQSKQHRAAYLCYCGNNYDYNRHGHTPDNCKAECSMNTDETCGGTSWVCPTGKYKGEGDAVIDDKPNCKNECHCKALPCLYLNGQCRDGCAVGWRGEACNERDCEFKNGGCGHQCTEDRSDEWCSCDEGFNVSPNNWRDCIGLYNYEMGYVLDFDF